jgi:uncharacterized protein (TIGR02677 family)
LAFWLSIPDNIRSLMEPLDKIRAFAYVTADKASIYRSIMRIFLDAKERFALHLRPADVMADLRGSGLPPDLEAAGIDNELTQLCEWGNLESRPDTAEVSTVDDFLRRRYLYQLTVKGEAAERAVADYEEAVLQPGELQAAALADIRGLLAELAMLAASEAPDEGKVHRNLITLRARFDELTRRAQSFMNGLQRRIDLQGIDLDVFLAYKQRLLDYLERFIQELIVATAEIAGTLVRIAPGQVDCLLRIAAGRDLADAVDRKEEDIEAAFGRWRHRWNGLEAWFISRNGKASYSDVLRSRARSAIPAMLSAIANINDRRITRIDRSNDLRALACWFAESATDGEAHRLWRAAFGLNPSRHLSTNDETIDAFEAARALTNASWFDVPPMRISIRLRTTGSHVRRGRVNSIIDRSEHKEYLAKLTAEEALQIQNAQNRLATGGRVRLSEMGKLDRGEFDLLLDLLGEALAMKHSRRDPVETVSSDGLLRILLEPVEEESAEAVLVTGDGTLSGPDYFVTIQQVFTETGRHVAVG